MKLTKKQNASVAYHLIGTMRRQLQEARDAQSLQACDEVGAIAHEIDKALGSLCEAQINTGHKVPEKDLEASAKSLAQVLFSSGRPEGTVGHDGWRLHVYVYAKTWRKFTKFVSWDAHPVVWHLGVGRPKTAA